MAKQSKNDGNYKSTVTKSEKGKKRKALKD